MKPRHLVFPVLLALASLSTVARANVGNIVLNNLPGTTPYVGGASLTVLGWEGVSLTTNGSAQNFSSLIAELASPTSTGTAEGGIYSNSGGSPGSLLAAFNNVSVPSSTAAPYSLTTTSPFTLQPSTTYWFVLHDVLPLAWEMDSNVSGNGTVPTAASGYAFNGYKSSGDSGSTWAADPHNQSLTITTVAAPEPATLSLAALGAVALLTRRRRVLPTPPSAVPS